MKLNSKIEDNNLMWRTLQKESYLLIIYSVVKKTQFKRESTPAARDLSIPLAAFGKEGIHACAPI